jgi:hypothetical protein
MQLEGSMRLRRTVAAHLRAAEVPTVETFQADIGAKPIEPVQAAPEQDEMEETVRRIVEAAYT